MKAEEARVGKRVRVSRPLERADLEGKEGTITGRWGRPEYAALDVRLDDGTSRIFWHHELEEDGTRPEGPTGPLR